MKRLAIYTLAALAICLSVSPAWAQPAGRRKTFEYVSIDPVFGAQARASITAELSTATFDGPVRRYWLDGRVVTKRGTYFFANLAMNGPSAYGECTIPGGGRMYFRLHVHPGADYQRIDITPNPFDGGQPIRFRREK